MRFACGDVEGPRRFMQKRSGTFVLALWRFAGIETTKIDFREIFGVVRFSTFGLLQQ